MQKVTITIETGNAAFVNHPGGEVARILRLTADQFDNGDTVVTRLCDVNGNHVGDMVITGRV